MLSQKETNCNKNISSDKPGYWAVIPSSVRYDQTLKPNAKLLYAEISALCGKEGYCWADNAYFADLYEVTERSIRALLAQLEELGYIKVEVVQKGNQNQKDRRRIWLAESIFLGSLRNKFSGAPEQIFRSHYIDNNINIINPPIAPQGATPEAKARKSGYKAAAEHEPERFEGFWSYYRSVTPAQKTPGNRQKAIAAWDRLRPDAALIDTMAKALQAQSRAESWREGYGVPHASTWINQHRWEDPVAVQAAAAAEMPAGGADGWD